MRFQSNSHNRTEANGAERSAAHCNGIELQRLGQLSVLPSLWTLRKLQPKRSFLIPCAASLPLVQTLQCFQGRDVYPNATEAPKQHNVSQSELSPALLVAAIHQVTPRGMLATPRLNAPEVSKFAMVPGVPDVVYKHGMIYAVDRCGIRKYNSVVCFAICNQCIFFYFEYYSNIMIQLGKMNWFSVTVLVRVAASMALCRLHGSFPTLSSCHKRLHMPDFLQLERLRLGLGRYSKQDMFVLG